MKNDAKSILVRITYLRGFADIEVVENGSNKHFDGFFKNDKKKPPYEYCVEVAKQIEAKMDTKISTEIIIESEWNRRTSLAYRRLIEKSYAYLISTSPDAFETADAYDMKITERMNDLNERVKAFPDDKQCHEETMDLCREAITLWSACESRLRSIYKACENDSEKTEIAKEINTAHEMVESYTEMERNAVIRTVGNTSKAYKSGVSIQQVGETMQNAGQSMQKAGNAMTIGCTVPIILIVLFLFLLMLMH